MKERRQAALLFLLFGFVPSLFLDLLANYRVFYQLVGEGGYFLLLHDIFSPFVDLLVGLGSVIGAKYSIFFFKLYQIIFISIYVSVATPLESDSKPSGITYMVASFAFMGSFILAYLSPYFGAFTGSFSGPHVYIYLCLSILDSFLIIYSFSRISKFLFSSSLTGMVSDIQSDPFGRKDRVFAQQTEKIENQWSINIPYYFTGITFEKVRGWINIINPFRAVMVIGTPGSGKSFAFFLPGIQQMIHKGFTMVIYDFKFSDLTKYAYNCLLSSSEFLLKTFGYIPEFCIISLEHPLYSERCNVLQPHLLQDFTVDAYGLAKAFMVAINPSWKNKEGDFFPESATNLAAAGIWALKIYKGGRYCTLPHLVEFLSLDTDSVVSMLINLKDGSLRNVVRPFEEAKADGAMEQLQGQMGTVRIALSRMTSPKLYFLLTEDEYTERFNLQVNSKAEPKIICLANSGQNAGVNNIVLSLFIVQISRFVNKKGQLPCGIVLDEAVTLSFPKNTLDVLIATGRGHLISVWLGFQDLSQLVRDLSRDVAEAIFKMVGNTVSGSVFDETAERLMKRIGKLKILKKSISVSAEGDLSSSYQENFDYAVPDSFISSMSQGTFCGTLSDNFDQKVETKAFYGEVDFKHPFPEMKDIPYSKYWRGVIERNCQGFTDVQIQEYADQLMADYKLRVVSDIEEMKADLLNPMRDN